MEKLSEYSIDVLNKTNCFQSEIFFEILKLIQNLINKNYIDINDEKNKIKSYFEDLQQENIPKLIIKKRMIFNFFETITTNNDKEERIFILLLKLYLENDDLEEEIKLLLSSFLKCINLIRKDIHDIFGLFSEYQRESKLDGKYFDKFLNYISIIYNYEEYSQQNKILNYFSIIPGNGFLIKIPQFNNSKNKKNDFSKYLTIIFSFKPLHFKQISTIFAVKKNNEAPLFLITLKQNNLCFTLKDKENKLISEIKEGWNNLCIFINRETNIININLNDANDIFEHRISESNEISEINLFGNFTGEVTSIYGYFKNISISIKKDSYLVNKNNNCNKELFTLYENSDEFKQGVFYIEENEENLKFLPYTIYGEKENTIMKITDLYEDNKLNFLFSPFLYLNNYENKNVLCDYYTFYICRIEGILIHNYKDYKGNFCSLGGLKVLYPIFIILNNEEIRTIERVNKLLLIIYKLLKNENNLKYCCDSLFWDLVCEIFEKWPFNFFNEELFNSIYLIFEILKKKFENLFFFYIAKNKKIILYALNAKIVFYINNIKTENDTIKIKEALICILKLMDIEIPNCENLDLITEIYLLYNQLFKDIDENITFIDEILLQFLYSFLLFETKINNKENEINIEENYIIKITKNFYNMFKNKDFENYKLDEENDSKKIICLYIPILFVINLVFQNKETTLNQIRERIISLFLKAIKNLFNQYPLVFSIKQNDFEINENNIFTISPSFINNLCIKFPEQNIILFDYLYNIIEKDNELIEEKNTKHVVCQGDYFLFLLNMSIINIDKNNPFFDFFSKISFEFVKKLTTLINIKNVLTKEENRKIILHKQVIKYHFFLIDYILKFKNDDKLTINLFNGIFKNFSLEREILEDIIDIPINSYEQQYIQLEKFSLNSINIKKMRRQFIKSLFSFYGYWADKKKFFSNEEESEENKLKSSLLKFKIMNFVTKDLKKPILTPILDFEEYLNNFSNENNELKVNDFYKKFSWFNKKIETEKNDFQKNIDDILNILISNKRNFIYSYFTKEMNQQSNLIYNAKLIKFGYENDCIFYIKKKSINNVLTINIYIIKDENANENNNSKPHFKIFPNLNKIKEKSIILKIEDILMFFPRIYNYEFIALELYLTNGKNYYFIFENTKDLKNIIQFLTTTKFNDSLSNPIKFCQLINYTNQNMEFDIKYKSTNGYNSLGYFSEKYINENILNDCLLQITKNNVNEQILILSKIIQLWKDNKISNYYILMFLNIISNRSFCDISQYPIFPWIIYQSNYVENNDNENNDDIMMNESIRDLSKPIGQLLNNERTKNFIKNYKTEIDNQKINYKKEGKKLTQNDINKIPIYSTNYSNLITTTNYLYRIYPFNLIFNECKKLDLTNENIFISIPFTFYNASNKSENDIREIIPDFFYFHEMFQNINKIDNLKDVELDKEIIENSDEINPYLYYCKFLKEQLEGDEISKNINKWIDLIFGQYQKGEKGKKKYNIFRYESYIDNLENNKIFCQNQENQINIYKLGLIPIQLFDKGSFLEKNYQQINYSVFHAVSQNCITKIDLNKLLNNNQSNSFCFYLENFGTSSYIFYNNYFCFTHKFKSGIFSNENIIKKFAFKFLGSQNLRDFPLYEDNKYKDSYCNHAFYYYDKVYYSFTGGFFNGKIKCFSFQNDEINNIKVSIRRNNNENLIFPYITALEIINSENYLITGDSKGDINIYLIIIYPRKEIKLKYFDSLYNHNEEIIYIHYNKDLNLLISTSNDGYINLYKINPFKCIKTYKSPYKDIKFTYLISDPIPLILIYTSSQILFTVLLNGFSIYEKNNNIKISNPHIIKSPNHEDLLMVSKDNTIFFISPCNLKSKSKVISFPYNIISYCFTKELDEIFGYCQNLNSKDNYICFMKRKNKNQ